MTRTILLPLILLISCNIYSQKLDYFDIYYLDDSNELVDHSHLELQEFIQKEIALKRSSEIAIEVFPNSNNSLQNDMVDIVSSTLEVNDLEAKRIVYFLDKSHLYFDHEDITDWNFIRIKFTYLEELRASTESKIEASPVLKEVEQTEITTEQATVLKLKQGTILEIPSDCFVDKDGKPVKGKVKIITEEILSKEDAIFSNVTTNIGDQFLESRGMVIVDAYDADNNPLEIAPGKSIAINIPTNDEITENSFSIYSGIKKDSVYDWILNENDVSPIKKSKSKRYEWKKINKEEYQEVKKQRQEVIANWQDRGESRKEIRQRLRKHETSFKKKVKIIKRNGKTYVTKSTRDLEKISRRMIVANSKYRWHKDTTFIPKSSNYYRIESYSLGMYNIDKIYKSLQPRNDLIAPTKKEMVVKLFFQKEFVLLEGEKHEDKTVFRSIPRNKKVIVFATSKKGNGDIELGYDYFKTGKEACAITNYQTYSTQEYKKKIKELTKAD